MRTFCQSVSYTTLDFQTTMHLMRMTKSEQKILRIWCVCALVSCSIGIPRRIYSGAILYLHCVVGVDAEKS